MTTVDQMRSAILGWGQDAVRPFIDPARVDGGVIFANPNAPIPPRPYATVRIITIQDIGMPNIGKVDDDGNVLVTADQYMTMSVQVLGGDALAIGRAMRRALLMEMPLEKLDAGGLAFTQYLTGLNDLSVIVGSQREPRANFDVQFGLNDEIEDPQGWIETIMGTGTLSPARSISYKESIVNA